MRAPTLPSTAKANYLMLPHANAVQIEAAFPWLAKRVEHGRHALSPTFVVAPRKKAAVNLRDS
jgi:hypothetical protein